MTEEMQTEPPHDADRSHSVSTALQATARRLRLSTSNRSALYKAVGLRPRPITQWVRVLFWVNIVAVLVIPNILVTAYYGFIASDQFQSETRFRVSTSIPALGKDQLAKVTGIPSAKIVQDTQIVTNYLTSVQMLDSLRLKSNLVSKYTRPDTDSIAALVANATQEELLRYWKGMVSSSIAVPSGIVTIRLRAFASDDARTLLTDVLIELERMVNEMNDRIWADVTKTAKENLKHASAVLGEAREKIRLAQGETGVFTVESSADEYTGLLSKLEGERIELQQRYDVNAASVSGETPQMRVLAREIASKDEQIKNLRSQITGSGGERPTLSETSRTFAQLQLEQQVAEDQFSASVKTLEQVQFSSRQQLVYLDAFVRPTLAQEAQYPKRLLIISLTAGATMLLWAIVASLLSFFHTRFS